MKDLSDEELKVLKEKYENLLAQDPSSVAFVFLAEILIKRGETDRAIDVLTRGLKHNPQNITAKFILGRMYYERQMMDGAKGEMEEIVKFAPDNVAASKILIQIYRGEDELDKALEVAHSVSVFFPGDNEIRDIVEELEKEIALAGAEGKEGGELLESVSEEDEELFSNLFKGEIYTETMADLYMNQGLYEEASKIFEKLVKLDSGNQPLRRKLEQARAYLLSEKAGFKIKR